MKLENYDEFKVSQFENYIKFLKNEKNKDGELKNPWASKKSDSFYENCFKKVDAEGLVIDGKHIAIVERGISYDYIAYKNKMLLVYPETKIDIQIIYKGDEFEFSKENGCVVYKHKFVNPFERKEENVVGGYCVIKNSRGEFLTTLSSDEIAKHRKIAKTDSIWKNWFYEMCLKTIVRKAVKFHFEDLYEKINEEENGDFDLSKLNDKNEIPSENEIIDFLKKQNNPRDFYKQIKVAGFSQETLSQINEIMGLKK